MKNVLLIGGTGFTGRVVLKELIDREFAVTVISRRQDSLSEYQNKIRILEGNVMNPLFVAEALKNQDAVINCLGIGGKGNGKNNTLLSDSTQILVDAMENGKVNRLIALSNVGAGDSRNFHPFIFRKFILPYFMKWLKVIIDDKNRMEPMIMESQLDWTIVRCPNVTNSKAKGSVHPTLSGSGLKLSITNSDLSKFLVDQLTSTQFIRKAPSISN